MNVLIIEDDVNKLKAIADFISNYNSNMECICKSSYQSGMRTLLDEKFDLLLLDMSMPIYDVANQKTGGRLLALAGRNILFQLRRRNILVPVIIITQYEDFDGLSSADLDCELQREFPQLYLGFVYYSITQDSWKEKLATMLQTRCAGGGKNL